MKRIILVAALALVSTGAWGWGNGVGESTGCASIGASIRQADEKSHQYLNWVEGYIVATKLCGNAATDRVSLLGNTKRPDEYIAIGLSQYCLSNPSGRLIDAAEALVEALKAKIDVNGFEPECVR